MTHPLTNEIALNLFSFERLLDASQPLEIEDVMRKAADWQLEKVVVWLRDNLDDRHVWADVLSPSPLPYVDVDVENIIIDLKEAMRPTQEES